MNTGTIAHLQAKLKTVDQSKDSGLALLQSLSVAANRRLQDLGTAQQRFDAMDRAVPRLLEDLQEAGWNGVEALRIISTAATLLWAGVTQEVIAKGLGMDFPAPPTTPTGEEEE